MKWVLKWVLALISIRNPYIICIISIRMSIKSIKVLMSIKSIYYYSINDTISQQYLQALATEHAHPKLPG